jgi:hypothetical protein
MLMTIATFLETTLAAIDVPEVGSWELGVGSWELGVEGDASVQTLKPLFPIPYSLFPSHYPLPSVNSATNQMPV